MYDMKSVADLLLVCIVWNPHWSAVQNKMRDGAKCGSYICVCGLNICPPARYHQVNWSVFVCVILNLCACYNTICYYGAMATYVCGMTARKRGVFRHQCSPTYICMDIKGSDGCLFFYYAQMNVGH
jgi:hypothetical protein